MAEDYVKEAHKPYVDGVHLDYVRMLDVVLPVSLWKNYGIEQKEELPEYDYCYCDTCRALFKAKTGQDPLELKYPMENQSWINFRLDAVTHVVEAITKAVKADHKFISAAVFPGPSMARKMVRQDWGNWSLDAYFPMIIISSITKERNGSVVRCRKACKPSMVGKGICRVNVWRHQR